LGDGAGGDSWRWLRWQSELELADQKLEFEFGVGVAAQQYLASICCWQMDIDHLDGGELVESASGCQPRRQGVEAARQGDVHTVSQEGDEDMGLDSPFVLMEDRADRQVALQVLEGLFDAHELNVMLNVILP